MKKIILLVCSMLALCATFLPGITVLANEYQNQIISYGTIIENEEVGISTFSNEYTIEEIGPELTTYSSENNEPMITNYVEPIKVENSAGTHYINYNNESAVVEYSSETNKLVSKSAINSVNAETMDENSEYFVVENGIIKAATEANVITIGGAEHINYIYPTVEDAHNQVNGTGIDGGAHTGSYTETISYEGNDYVHVTFSGYDGYMSINDVQIIPSYIEMNTSYYFSEDGVWYYASAIDPLVSNELMVMPTSDAPTWAEEGVKYYSNDTETFTTDEYMAPETYVNYTNSAYFQNLSVRSTSGYSAAQYDSFLAYKGYTESEYYGHTQAFVDAQELYGINSLLLFSMANLESAYGTSSYAKQCNNFFGRGAFDSNPDNACAGRQFPQPEDGILAQGIFLSVNFLDQADWRYEGSYVGTLNGGLNTHYATDPDWGQKIGSLAYECDNFLGSKDNNYFKIVEIKGDVPVYTTSAMTTQVRAQGVYMCNEDKTQCIDADNPNSYVDYYIGRQTDMPVRVVVTGETSNAYEIQVETAKNQGASGFVTWTYAETGDHPNYEGANHGASGTSDENYVSSGYLNFANDYNSMSANQFWIPKTYNGQATTTTVANNTVKDTQRSPAYSDCTDVVSDSINSDGDRVVAKEASDGTKTCTTTYWGNTSTKKTYLEQGYFLGERTFKKQTSYNNSGVADMYQYYNFYYASTNEISYYNYIDYENGVAIEKGYYYYYESGNIKSNENYYYSSSTGLCYNHFKYTYNESGKKLTYIDHNYHSNGKKAEYFYKQYTNGVTTYYNYIKYTSTGITITNNFYHYYTDGVLKSMELYSYNSLNGYATNRYIYNYNTEGQKISYTDYNYHSNGKKYQYFYKEYKNGITSYYKYSTFSSSGVTLSNNFYRYYENGNLKSMELYEYNVNSGKAEDRSYYEYNSNGKKIKYVDYYYSNGVLTGSNTYYY